MITQWGDLVGRKITGMYHASGGTAFLLDDDEYAVLIGVLGYEDDAHATLADADNEDALRAAVLADAPGARTHWDAVVAKRLQRTQEKELRRLAYLQRKYPKGGSK